MKKQYGNQLIQGYILPKAIISKTKATNENAHQQQKFAHYIIILWINMQKLLKTNYLVNNHIAAGWGDCTEYTLLCLPCLILSQNCGGQKTTRSKFSTISGKVVLNHSGANNHSGAKPQITQQIKHCLNTEQSTTIKLLLIVPFPIRKRILLMLQTRWYIFV